MKKDRRLTLVPLINTDRPTLVPFQVFSGLIVPAVDLSVEDGVHVLGCLYDEAQHIPLLFGEVIDV